MKVNPISFGKAIKIKSDFETANAIARIANSEDKAKTKEEQKIHSQIRTFFNDVTTKGKAIAIKSEEDGVQYILSGKDAQKEKKFYFNYIEALELIRAHGSSRSMMYIACGSIIKQYYDNIENLVEKSNQNYTIEAKFNQDKDTFDTFNIKKEK